MKICKIRISKSTEEWKSATLNHLHSWHDRGQSTTQQKRTNWKKLAPQEHKPRNRTSPHFNTKRCNVKTLSWSSEGNIRTSTPYIRREILHDDCLGPRPWVMSPHLEWRSTPERESRSCLTCKHSNAYCREYMTKQSEQWAHWKVRSGLHISVY